MRKEFKAAIIVFIGICFLTIIAPALYNGPSGIDGIGSALAYVILIRLIQAVLLVILAVLVITGIARKNNWGKKRTIIAAITPIILLLGIIVVPFISDKLERKIYLKTHPVQDLFSAKITNVSWIYPQDEEATYLVLEYELTNIKADYFEKFGYKLSEMFSPGMNEANCQPYFVSQNGEELDEPYFEYVRDNEALYNNYLHTGVHSGMNGTYTLRPGERQTFCSIFRLEDDTTPIDVNFVFKNGYTGGAGVVYSETITTP